jgi:nitrogen fixation protein FixH
MTARGKWLLAIVGLLAANLVAMVVLAVSANRGRAQVIPDYYTRATHYDDELARSEASRALGWRVEIAARGLAIDARVSDAAGRPLDGARVRLTGYHRAHAAEPVALDLVAAAAGHHLGALPVPGAYDLVASVEAGGAHYTQRVVVEAR